MKRIIILTFALFLSACSNFDSGTAQLSKEVHDSQVIQNTVYVDNLAIAAQPTKEDLNNVKKEGYEIVVNLRNPNEFKDYNEAKYVSELNLRYYNVPFFNNKKEINMRSLKMVSKLIKDNPNKKIYIHCSSGNRVSAWYLTHLHLEEGLSLDQATKIARRTGLTKPALENKIISSISTKD